MQDLRLIGVHEHGHHLLLTDADGGRYRLSLDEALRAAARRDRPRLGQLQIEIEGGLRPREVQALVRRGLSTEEVADRAGWTVEKVRRFEGPVLAEREHVAQVAQQCAVGSHGTGPVTLAERVAERLKDRGVEREAAVWDSARDDEGVWALMMTFPAGGRERTATWRYEPLGGSVTATNDEARWLSEEAVAGAIPTPHRVSQPGDLDVYDIDADGGVGRGEERAAHAPIDLMAAMREHSTRGRRPRRRPSPSQTGAEDRPRPDALPIEELALDPTEAPPPPAARARNPVSAHLEDAAPEDVEVGGWPEDALTGDDGVGDHGVGDHGVGDHGVGDHEDSGPRTASATASPTGAHDGPDRATSEDAPRRPAASRRSRPSVPSWDDIVFGTRGTSG